MLRVNPKKNWRSMRSSIIFVYFMVSILGMSNVAVAEQVGFTVHGLDLSQVHLALDVPHGYYKQFYKRVGSHLSRAGLTYKTAKTYKQGESVLRLTMRVESMGNDCPGHYLYAIKLEVQELVVPVRSPSVRAFAVTWSLGSLEPKVRNTIVTTEEMEKDLDRVLKVFLLEYKIANQ